MKERESENDKNNVSNQHCKKELNLGKKIEIDDNSKSAYKAWKEKKITAIEAMKKAEMKRNKFYR